MICGCPAFKVKFDTAVSKEAYGNVLACRFGTNASSSRDKNGIAWRLFQTENKKADAVKQTDIS